MLHALAEDSVPALMHCAAGKDRAGLSIAVTLLAVGVERDAIVADYLESNAQHRRYRVRRNGSAAEAYSPEVLELLNPLFGTRPEYLDGGLGDDRGDLGRRRRLSGARAWVSPPRCGSGCGSGSSTEPNPASVTATAAAGVYCFAPTSNSR